MKVIGDSQLRDKLELGRRFADAAGFEIRLRYADKAQLMRDVYEEQMRITELTVLDGIYERDCFTVMRRLA
jgi:hypothetical protein